MCRVHCSMRISARRCPGTQWHRTVERSPRPTLLGYSGLRRSPKLRTRLRSMATSDFGENMDLAGAFQRLAAMNGFRAGSNGT